MHNHNPRTGTLTPTAHLGGPCGEEGERLDLGGLVSRKQDFIPPLTRAVKEGWAPPPAPADSAGSMKRSKSIANIAKVRAGGGGAPGTLHTVTHIRAATSVCESTFYPFAKPLVFKHCRVFNPRTAPCTEGDVTVDYTQSASGFITRK